MITLQASRLGVQTYSLLYLVAMKLINNRLKLNKPSCTTHTSLLILFVLSGSNWKSECKQSLSVS